MSCCLQCDEIIPACTQCRTTGRTCPGPISGIIVRDMTTTISQASVVTPARPHVRVHEVKRNTRILGQTVANSPASAIYRNTLGVRFPHSSPDQRGNFGSPVRKEDNSYTSIERLGSGTNPFNTLPLGSHFSAPKLIDHCTQDQTSRLRHSCN